MRAALTGLLAPTRQEAGCLNYDLHAAPEDPVKFLFHENWTSKAALDAHLQSPHISALLPRVDELCTAFPQITTWERVDDRRTHRAFTRMGQSSRKSGAQRRW